MDSNKKNDLYLDFGNSMLKDIALNTKSVNYETDKTAADAFFAVLYELPYEVIDNLCREVAMEYSVNPMDIYKLIQSQQNEEEFKQNVLKTAYRIVNNGKKLGNKLDGKHNASNWISHCLFEGKVAAEFATAMGLNADTAMKIGILHDIGRKFSHSFNHIILGFEYLMNLGYKEEAFCALTHTFLPLPKDGIYQGNRCANCDPPNEGFYITEEGKGAFEEGSRMDDITKFLDNYEYNEYDIILNIADLMAKSDEITSPYERMLDVYSRKKPDDRNSPYFKVCFINALNRLLYMITKNPEYTKTLNIKEITDQKELDSMLQETSNIFMNKYQEISVNNEKKHPVLQ